MAIGPRVVVDLDNEDENNDDNQSISEVMASLKWSFQGIDFNKAEGILVAREKKLRVDFESMKEENDLLKEKYELERLDKLGVENELKKQEKESWDLKQLNAQLIEERKIISERERSAEERCENLLEEVKKVGEEDKQMIIELRSKNCELECARRKAETEVEIWKRKFVELETRVLRLEEDTAMLINGERPVSKKGGVSGEVLGEKGMMGNSRVQSGTNVKSNCPSSAHLETEVNALNCDVDIHLEAGVGPSFHSPIKGNGDTQSAGSGRHPSGDIVEIIDDDDEFDPRRILSAKEMTSQKLAHSTLSGQTGVQNGSRMLKRKRASCLNISEDRNGDNDRENYENVDDDSPSRKCKMKNLQEWIREPASSPVNHCLAMAINHCSATAVSSGSNDVDKISTPVGQDTCLRRCEEKTHAEQNSQHRMTVVLDGLNLFDSEDSSSSSDSDDDMDLDFDFYKLIPTYQRYKDDMKWEFVADMLVACEKDNELYMKAVCALYRQQTSVGKSLTGSSKNQGVDKFDALRLTTLAEFLIDGDSQGNLKKSMKELLAYDRGGLDDCKRLAKKHSKQLFEIYQKKMDPLFPS